MKEMDSFSIPGLYSDVGYTKLLASWNSLEDDGIVRVDEGVLSGSSTLDETPRLKGFLLIPKCVERIADYAFTSEVGLRGIRAMGELESIGDSAFAGCNDLEVVEVKCISIKKDAFMRCARLKRVKSINPTLTIANSAFCWCVSLEDVLVSWEASIDEKAFFGCNNVKLRHVEDEA